MRTKLAVLSVCLCVATTMLFVSCVPMPEGVTKKTTDYTVYKNRLDEKGGHWKETFHFTEDNPAVVLSSNLAATAITSMLTEDLEGSRYDQLVKDELNKQHWVRQPMQIVSLDVKSIEFEANEQFIPYSAEAELQVIVRFTDIDTTLPHANLLEKDKDYTYYFEVMLQSDFPAHLAKTDTLYVYQVAHIVKLGAK